MLNGVFDYKRFSKTPLPVIDRRQRLVSTN